MNLTEVPYSSGTSERPWPEYPTSLPSAPLRHRITRLLFRDLYRQFGSRIRLLITGMAPIRRDIGLILRSLPNFRSCEAYGMVEAGVLAFRSASSKEYASVGKPCAVCISPFKKMGNWSSPAPRSRLAILSVRRR